MCLMVLSNMSSELVGTKEWSNGFITPHWFHEPITIYSLESLQNYCSLESISVMLNLSET